MKNYLIVDHMVCNRRQSTTILLTFLIGFASVVNSLKPSSTRPLGVDNAYLSQLEQQSRRQAKRDVWPVASALASAISPLSALAMDNKVPTPDDMHSIFRDAVQNFEDMQMIFPLSNLDEKISAAIATAFAPAAASSYYTQPPVGFWNAPPSVPGTVPTNAELSGTFHQAIDKLTNGLQMAYEKLDNLEPEQKIAATVAAIVISYPVSYEYYKYELREEERKAEQKRAVMKAKKAALAKKKKEEAEKKKKKKSGVKGEKKKKEKSVAKVEKKKKKKKAKTIVSADAAAYYEKRAATPDPKEKKQAVIKGEKKATKPEPVVAVEKIPEPVAVDEMVENPVPVVASTNEKSSPPVTVTIRPSAILAAIDGGSDAYAAAYAALLAETQSAAVPGDNAAAAEKSPKEAETVGASVGGGTGTGSYLDSLLRRP